MSRILLNPHRFTSAPPPAGGIQFVGREEVSRGALSGGAISGSLTALSPQPGDFMLCFLACATNTDRSFTIQNAGFTNIDYRRINSSIDATISLDWKIMTARPDTTITYGFASNSSVSRAAIIVELWRGVDATTPIDQGPNFQGSGSSVTQIFASCTPVTPGAAVLGFISGAHDQDDQTYSASGWDDTFSAGIAGGNHKFSYLCAHKFNVSGVFSPAQATFSGTDSTSYSVATTTLALRPA